MKSHQDCLDFLPLNCSNFGWLRTPPCNSPIAFIVGTIGSIAGAAIQYSSAQNAAKQAELNAQAQADAIGQERSRQALEADENQRRAVVEQRRVRSQQLAAMSSSGAILGTGTSLAIEADTWAKQQTELADQQRMADLSQRNLGFQQSNALAMGAQQASQIRSDAVGAAISGLASAASAFSTKAKPGTTTGGSSSGGKKP